MSRSGSAFAVAVILVTLPLAGCTGGSDLGELSARPKPRNLAPAAPLKIPGDEPFTILFAPSSKQPGLGGTAEANAFARPDGSAEAGVRISDGGRAQAAFQIGHAVRNDSDRQVELEVAIRYRYEYRAETQTDARNEDARIALKLFARDDSNRLLRSMDLLDYATGQGAAQRSGAETLSFRVTLGPGIAANIYLGGEAAADTTRTPRNAAAMLKLSEVTFEIVSRPAPAVGTAHEPR